MASLLLFLVLAVFAQPVFGAADFSGEWKLNAEKSKWGQHQKPTSVFVTIDQKSGVYSYSGDIVKADGEQKFSFSGPVDGKEYPASTEYGQGHLMLTWTSARTITETFRSSDGQTTVITKTSLSANGNLLTRQIELKSPDQNTSWTEVYERQR